MNKSLKVILMVLIILTILLYAIGQKDISKDISKNMSKSQNGDKIISKGYITSNSSSGEQETSSQEEDTTSEEESSWSDTILGNISSMFNISYRKGEMLYENNSDNMDTSEDEN